jgi:excisionase family DNA binding protein
MSVLKERFPFEGVRKTYSSLGGHGLTKSEPSRFCTTYGLSALTKQLLYTIEEAHTALSVSRSTLYRLIDAGALPVIYLGTAPRVSVKALESYIDRQVRAARLGNL